MEKKAYNIGDDIYWIVDKNLMSEHLMTAPITDVADHGYIVHIAGRSWVVPFSEVVDDPEKWVAPDFDKYDF